MDEVQKTQHTTKKHRSLLLIKMGPNNALMQTCVSLGSLQLFVPAVITTSVLTNWTTFSVDEAVG